MVNWWELKEGMIKRIENDFFKKGAGWKIHLTVNPDNQRRVYDWLLENCPYSCKYKSADKDAGKDFTIYIGSYDETEVFGVRLTKELGNLLLNTGSDAAVTDLGITQKIGARFQPPKIEEFGENGYHGMPLLFADASNQI